jgi:hypothetical protein
MTHGFFPHEPGALASLPATSAPHLAGRDAGAPGSQRFRDTMFERSSASFFHEPRFAKELPRIPPLPFRRGEARGEGSVFTLGFRGAERVKMSG